MLVRIIQLAMALYYGQLKRKEAIDTNSTPEGKIEKKICQNFCRKSKLSSKIEFFV